MKYIVYMNKSLTGSYLSPIEEVNNPKSWDCSEGVLYFLLENGERVVYAPGTWTHFMAEND